jgi:hypothetical protein
VLSRERILLISLWLSVVALTTWVGGTLYQMVVIVPLWSAAPPESVRTFFNGTDWNRTIFNFFGPPFIIARNVPLLAALVAGWHLPRHRRALLVAVLCFAGFAAIFTITFVYPINAVLFEQAGGTGSADEIRALVRRWILLDRIRFLVGLVGFAALLHAFRIPISGDRIVKNSDAGCYTRSSDGKPDTQFMSETVSHD